MLLFGDLRFVPNDPTTIGACFAAQTEELITAIIDRSISLLLLLCLLLLRALFFVSKPRKDCCVAKAVLFFSSVQQKLLLRLLFCCSRPKKKENFSSENLSTWSPLLFAAATNLQNQRKLVCVCGIKFFSSLFLCIKLKLFSRSTL